MLVVWLLAGVRTCWLGCMMPRVGKVQVQTEGRSSESAKLTYCTTLAASRSVVPLSWLLATVQGRHTHTQWYTVPGGQDRVHIISPTIIGNGVALCYSVSIACLKCWNLHNTGIDSANLVTMHTNSTLHLQDRTFFLYKCYAILGYNSCCSGLRPTPY